MKRANRIMREIPGLAGNGQYCGETVALWYGNIARRSKPDAPLSHSWATFSVSPTGRALLGETLQGAIPERPSVVRARPQTARHPSLPGQPPATPINLRQSPCRRTRHFEHREDGPHLLYR